jgi:Xaa-Pro aminopeptidase
VLDNAASARKWAGAPPICIGEPSEEIRRCLGNIVLLGFKNMVAAARPRHHLSDQVLQPGMVLVIEPNAVTADGMFGIFFGHTFIITEGEPECVDGYPWDLTIV